MKSAAIDKVSFGDDTAKPKRLRKSTASMKRKDTTKYAVNDNDGLCGIEIYEVVGNVQEEGNEGSRFAQVQNQAENCKKLGDCEESVVIGNEVLLRITNQKETPKNNKDDDFLGIRYIVEGQNDGGGKHLAFLGKGPEVDVRLGTSTVKNTISLQDPDQSLDSNNAGIMLGTPLDGQMVQGCELLLVGGNEPTVSTLYTPAKAGNDVNSKGMEKERLVDRVNPTEGAADAYAAGEKVNVEAVESCGSGSGTSNGIFVTGENKENKKNHGEQDSGDKTGSEEMMDHCNGGEELVVSSGPAWDTEVQLGSEFYGSVDNNDEDEDEDEDEDLIGELKINEAGSLEFIKRYVGETVGENGTTVEIRGGKIVKKSGEEDKGTAENEDFGSLLEEDGNEEGGVEESGKRKRIRKGGVRRLNLKKRKTEKCRQNELNDHSDSERGNKGIANTEKSNRKDSVNSTSSICDQTTLEETIDRVASGHLSLPFLESLRGSIKALSRGDLEELIVQKLCEVITERSTVGHLRKRAEALERNQERWKEKVLSLTKQIKEMDMVMKNYLSEVRRHHTEKSFQMVAPLRVTRSVGLQVSFTSAPSKLARIMPKGSGEAYHGLDKGMKQQFPRTVYITQSPNKKISLLPTTAVKKSLVIDPKNKLSPKSGVNLTLQGSGSSEAQLAIKQALHIQQPKLATVSVETAEANSSNLIDLTDDDDRQTQDIAQNTSSQQSVTVRPPGQIRVVNHIQPAQSSAGAYLFQSPGSPTCSSSSSSSGAQNRPIATSSAQPTQRHILPSVPPLLYKGSTLMQPGSQQQVVANQSRALLAKPMKHPAPLPQPPSNQIQKPNWKQLPPRPALKISKGDTGIVLSWNMPLGPEYETIVSYQLFAYQESEAPPCTSLWKRVGDVKALPLPMACTLTQFLTGHKYYFAVRAVDMHSRVGPFSFPGSIALIK